MAEREYDCRNKIAIHRQSQTDKKLKWREKHQSAEPKAQETGCGNEVKRTVELIVTLPLVTCTDSEEGKDELSGVLLLRWVILFLMWGWVGSTQQIRFPPLASFFHLYLQLHHGNYKKGGHKTQHATSAIEQQPVRNPLKSTELNAVPQRPIYLIFFWIKPVKCVTADVRRRKGHVTNSSGSQIRIRDRNK